MTWAQTMGCQLSLSDLKGNEKHAYEEYYSSYQHLRQSYGGGNPGHRDTLP